MKKNQLAIRLFFAVVCAIFLNNTSFAEPANLARLKAEVVAYHDSGAYQKELTAVISHADHFIIKRAKTNALSAHPQKLAVVLDIDETSLSNYDKMAARQFASTSEQLHQDIRAGDAPAIKPMLSLYNDAIKNGITVFFVTGRWKSEREITAKNLKKIGYHDWAKIYVKPEHYTKPSVVPFKSQARASIEKQGYTIIASIGDQYSDLKGGYAEKTFKLPNPYYYIP